ncbi:hypothetical protein BKA65DRAFT_233075 [Rhexocercosporidium sp. MPI-PUGE-AT-0058]|nr:hypothetical protein BKA65DRAFT_233075 [Rhexocercosporidium sp. MPI-PUGE-AT-0058]
MQLSTLSDTWAWEILSLASCIACSTALITILALSHGNNTPQLPYQISLNTVASILATAAKASLLTAVAAAMGQNKWLKFRSDKAVTRLSAVKLFDDASRGPLGALILLFSGRRGRALAVLGAFVVVTSVAFEAFVQQAISYPLQVIYTPSDHVRMPVNKRFYVPWSLSHLPWLSYTAETALLGSALGASAVPEVSATCPTGNCTWGPYSTLVLCSSCVDVSEFAGKNYKCDPDVSEEVIAVNLAIPALDDGSNITCNYTLTDGGSTTWTSHLSSRPSLQSARLGMEGPQSDWANGKFANIQTPAYAFEMIWTHEGYNTPPRALECAVTFCVNSYYAGSSVTNGALNASPRATIYPAIAYDSEIAPGSYLLDVEGSNGSQDKETFGIDFLSLFLLRSSLDRLLLFSLGKSGPEPRSDFLPLNIELQLLVNETDVGYFPIILDRTVGNFSRYMTNVSDASVGGNAGELRSHVRITWLWLVFPFALVVLGVVFVCITILETRGRAHMVWKESSVTLLFHGLENLPGAGGGAGVVVLDSVSGMEKMADEMRVRLGRAGDGSWKLLGG